METSDQPPIAPTAGSGAGPGLSRRRFLRRAGLGLGTIAVVGAGGLSYRAYDQGVLQVGQGPAYEPWSDWRQHEGLVPLVAAATLAPNPHNSQPWLFRLGRNRIDLFADGSRNIGAIDPFAREKHVGLGAALENLVLAGQELGYQATVTLMPEGAHSAHAARVELARSARRTTALAAQIAKRHTNRYPFVAGKDVPASALSAMAALGDRDTGDSRLYWFAGAAQRARLGELLVAATEAIIRDPDQSRSDFEWFRQSWDEIQRQRDGITVDAAGLSELLPDSADPDLLARVRLVASEPPSPEEEALFEAIPKRRTTRAAYEERQVPADVQRELVEEATGEGAWLHLVTDGEREAVGDLISLGSPLVVRTFDLGKGQAARDRELAEHSPVLTVLGTGGDSPREWLAAGQAMERVLLRACSHGLTASFLNQPVEVEAIRPPLADAIGRSGTHPQLVIRFGYGPAVQPSPREKVEEVLVEDG